MKTKINVWTLAWDTSEGTGCLAFGSRYEWLSHFGNIIKSSVEESDSKYISEIMKLLESGDIDSAYEYWEKSLKSPLHTYSWDCQEILVELDATKIT